MLNIILILQLLSVPSLSQGLSCVSLFQQPQVELSDEVTEGLYKLAEDQVRTQKLPMSESKNMILREIKRQVFEKASEYNNPEVVFFFYRKATVEIAKADKESTETVQARNERRRKFEIITQQQKVQKIEELKIKYKKESLEEVFYLAASRNDVEAIKFLLKAGVNINAINLNFLEETALHGASKLGNIDIVKLLLEAGIDPSVRNEYEETALNIAANKEQAEVMKLLLEAGAIIDSKDFLGDTALFTSVRTGNLSTVRLLLEAGANTEIQGKRKITVLQSAVDMHTLRL